MQARRDEVILRTEQEVFATAFEEMYEDIEIPHPHQRLRAFTLRISPKIRTALMQVMKRAHQFGFFVGVSRNLTQNEQGEEYYTLTFTNARPPLGS